MRQESCRVAGKGYPFLTSLSLRERGQGDALLKGERLDLPPLPQGEGGVRGSIGLFDHLSSDICPCLRAAPWPCPCRRRSRRRPGTCRVPSAAGSTYGHRRRPRPTVRRDRRARRCLPVLHDQDLVGVDDGGQAVGDHQGGVVGGDAPQGGLDGLLGARVQGRGGLVEDQDGGIFEDHPGDGHPLLLAARQLQSAFAHRGVIALGRGLDELVQVGQPRRLA